MRICRRKRRQWEVMIITYEETANGERLQMWAAVHRQDTDKIQWINNYVVMTETLPWGGKENCFYIPLAWWFTVNFHSQLWSDTFKMRQFCWLHWNAAYINTEKAISQWPLYICSQVFLFFFFLLDSVYFGVVYLSF